MADIPRLQMTAYERYQLDMRFHAQVQSIVAHVMQKHGRVDPDRADREAHDIATSVAAMVLEMVFTDDAELRAQREMADRYRKIAEDVVFLTPPTFLVRPKTGSSDGV